MIKFATTSLLITLSLMVSIGVLFPTISFAQVTTANIEGAVRDEQGNPAVDVQIVAKNQETGYYQVTYSSAKGKYRVASLIPGMYQLSAQHVNFNTLIKKNIQLEVGQTAVIDFSLTGKEVQLKEVVVEAEVPLIDTKKSEISVTVRPEQIINMPLNSRNFLELALIAPFAKGSTGGRGPVTTGALNSRFISAYIDGGEFKSDGLGGVLGTSFGYTTNIVPEDAILEFQVITSLYKAEYSKASNGILNAITKIGSNELHGTAFSLFRTRGLNSRGPFETRPDPLTGEVKPDFNRQQYGVSIGGPIVRDQTHFFLSYERNNINNFITVFNGGRQSALEGTFKSPTVQNLFLARITHQFSGSNSLDVRWLHVDTDNTPGNFGSNLAFSNGFNLSFRLNSYLATDRWLIGNNIVNELRLHYQRYLKIATANSDQPERVYLSSGIVTGWNDVQPQTEKYERYQIRDDISYSLSEMMGTHTFKGGINFEREPLGTDARFSSGGVLTFRTDTSALPFQGAIGIGDASTHTLNYKFGIYVQDDWSPIPNLTLNLGLRWDFETQMINNDYVNPLAGDTALTNHVPANYIGNGHRDIDYGQVAPRVGFAWDLFSDRKTVVHGGFGWFYDRIIFNFPNNEQQNGRYSIYTIRFGTTAPPTLSRDTLISYVQRGAGGAALPSVTLLPSSVPTPYTRQLTIGISHQITSSLAASLNYVSIRGFNEYTTYNVNYQKGIGGPRVTTPRYAGIFLLTPTGNSWYDGIHLSISRPYHGDWQLQLSYTLSWAFNTFDDPFQGYVFQSSILRARSSQDERHRLAISGIVDLPYGFQISGIFSLASPRPMNVITGTDNNVDGVLGDDFPPSGRNSIRQDMGKIRFWSKNLNFRIAKYFDFAGTRRIMLIAEAFNLFNWTNYTVYFSRLSQSIFGDPSSADAPRQIQLGARVIF